MQIRIQRRQLFLSIVLVISIVLSAFPPPAVFAQGVGGVRRQVNAQTGKVSFLLPEGGDILPAQQALSGMSLSERRADPAMALAQRFGVEFGLQDPRRELVEMRRDELRDGRFNVRYQQSYQGIPVMGGELIVHTNEQGDLYSINGEVGRDISVPTEPSVQPEQAQHSALQAVAKWYQKTPEDLNVSPAELWVFDPSLLMPGSHPAELVWRMEVTSLNQQVPIRELVLVNAIRGNISLHFNQIDTAWVASSSVRSQPAEVPQRVENTSQAAV